MGNGSTCGETEYKELNTTIRHYSNLRFLILPIFFAINGGMFVATQGDKTRTPVIMYFILVLLAAFVSHVFCTLEKSLDDYLEAFVKHMKEIRPDGFWSRRPDTRSEVTNGIISLYRTVVFCWVLLAIFKLF